jgi:hypothetical protein
MSSEEGKIELNIQEHKEGLLYFYGIELQEI